MDEQEFEYELDQVFDQDRYCYDERVYWRRGDPPETWPMARARIIQDERHFHQSEIEIILPDLRWYERGVSNCRYALKSHPADKFWASILAHYWDRMWELRRRLARAVKGLIELAQPDYLAECPF